MRFLELHKDGAVFPAIVGATNSDGTVNVVYLDAACDWKHSLNTPVSGETEPFVAGLDAAPQEPEEPPPDA